MDKITIDAVAITVQANIPTLLWGGPGTGKTSFISNLATILDLPIEIVIASIREPSDFAGLPVVRDDGVRFEPPVWARNLYNSGKGIVFFDEISTAPPAVQAALLRIVHEGVVGDLVLPPTIHRVAAANPPDQAAGGWELSPPLANRWAHFDWRVNYEAWADGATTRWRNQSVDDIPVLPDDWGKNISQTLALVAAYIHRSPASLFHLPESEAQAGRAWPSPRTWEMAAIVLAAAQSVGATEDVEAAVMAAAVGNGAALQFLTWRKSLDLPEPAWLLENVDSYDLPKKPDVVYAIISSALSLVCLDESNLQKYWYPAWKLLSKVVRGSAPDVAAFAAKNLVKYANKQNMLRDLPIPKKELATFAPILREVRGL